MSLNSLQYPLEIISCNKTINVEDILQILFRKQNGCILYNLLPQKFALLKKSVSMKETFLESYLYLQLLQEGELELRIMRANSSWTLNILYNLTAFDNLKTFTEIEVIICSSYLVQSAEITSLCYTK